MIFHVANLMRKVCTAGASRILMDENSAKKAALTIS